MLKTGCVGEGAGNFLFSRSLLLVWRRLWKKLSASLMWSGTCNNWRLFIKGRGVSSPEASRVTFCDVYRFKNSTSSVNCMVWRIGRRGCIRGCSKSPLPEGGVLAEGKAKFQEHLNSPEFLSLSWVICCWCAWQTWKRLQGDYASPVAAGNIFLGRANESTAA